MPKLKNKKQAAVELAKRHAKVMLLSKELSESLNEINRILTDYFPEMQATMFVGSQKKNDLVSDEEMLKRLNALVEEEEMHLTVQHKSLKDIAKKLDVTQKRLKTMFSNNPEYSNLHKLLCHHRIMTACQLIKEHPNYSIEAISKECGFTSRKSFYRWFSEEMGCTPLEYQERSLTP